MQSTNISTNQQTTSLYSRTQQQQQLQSLQQPLLNQQIHVNQGASTPQQLHQNLIKNANANAGATNDFRLGQSQNMPNRNYQNTASVVSEVNGTTSSSSTWSTQNTNISQGVARTVAPVTATTLSISSNQPTVASFSQNNNNIPEVI